MIEIDEAVIDRIQRGELSHEEVADMFVQTVVGKSIGIPRDEFLAVLLEKFPTPEQLAVSLREMFRMYEAWEAANKINRGATMGAIPGAPLRTYH